MIKYNLKKFLSESPTGLFHYERFQQNSEAKQCNLCLSYTQEIIGYKKHVG